MKKSYLLLLIPIVCALVSCSKEVSYQNEIKISASFVTDNTKTLLDDGGTVVLWNPGDEIKVFYESTSGKFTSTATEPVAKSDFIGNLNIDFGANGSLQAGKYLWAVYPYDDNATYEYESVITTLPSEQIGKPGSFSNGANIGLAQSSTFNLKFYNVCGGVRFSVTHEGVKEVIFKGNNNECLAGRAMLRFDYGVPYVYSIIDDFKESITLTAPDNETFEVGKWYYLTAFPRYMSKGFTLRFNTEDQYAELNYSSPVTIKRSVFGSLAEADKNLSYIDKVGPGVEAVDLGLSVKWASCNVGATKPEEYGLYCAWGEVPDEELIIEENGRKVKRTYYTRYSYKWCEADPSNISIVHWTKYNSESYYGTVDDKSVPDSEDDVAATMIGQGWRLPSYEEWKELWDNCEKADSTVNGINGKRFTSKVAGYTDKSIFLPYGAGLSNDVSSTMENTDGGYWSSSIDSENYRQAYYEFLRSGVNTLRVTGLRMRYFGLSVRAVYGDRVPVSALTLDKESINISLGNNYHERIKATVTPENTTDKHIKWSSSNASVATVDSYGNVVACSVGTTDITATCGNQSKSCHVTVESMQMPEAVDLGLSVKWASCNVGAASPNDYGDYYSWGDPSLYYRPGTASFLNPVFLSEKYSGFSYESNKWFNKDISWYTKYITSDGKATLELDDDVANRRFNGTWRIPTKEEWEELMDPTKCSWQWVRKSYFPTSGSGYLITSKVNGYEGKSIFLPAAGIFSSLQNNSTEGCGGYMTSSMPLEDYSGGKVWITYLNSSRYEIVSFERIRGFTVRPVCD